MVTENGGHRKKRKLRDDGDVGATLKSRTKDIEPAPKKRRSPEDSDSAPNLAEEVDDEEELEEDEDQLKKPVGANAAAGASAAETAQGKKTKHIHPCICDLTKQQREKIDAHLARKRNMQRKYDKRVKEIEEELARLEEERLEREREMQEQEELFGDEYELVGKKRKRKKRSARRASMVSLGVKQVINWRKQPRIEVKMTTCSSLRKKYTSYCGRHEYPLSPIRPIDFHKEPALAIRSTVASDMRSKVNIGKKEWLIKHEDKRKIFETPYYVWQLRSSCHMS